MGRHRSSSSSSNITRTRGSRKTRRRSRSKSRILKKKKERSPSRSDDNRRRRKGWDADPLPNGTMVNAQVMSQVKNLASKTQNVSGDKKLRELYVGNLVVGMVD